MTEHCMEYAVPDFRVRVKAGQQILVAGTAFGVGSSREQAPRALKGTLIRTIAKLDLCAWLLKQSFPRRPGN